MRYLALEDAGPEVGRCAGRPRASGAGSPGTQGARA